MKAAVFHQPGQPLSIQDIPTPTISSREMLVKVSHCGICGTDIHASKEGPFMAPPETVFGHEFTGEIVSIGDDLVDGTFSVGDRITSLPFIEDKPSVWARLAVRIVSTSKSATTWWSNCQRVFPITTAHWWSHSPWDSIPSKWQVKYEKNQYSSSEQAQLDHLCLWARFLAPNMSSSAKWRRRDSPWPKPLASLTL